MRLEGRVRINAVYLGTRLLGDSLCEPCKRLRHSARGPHPSDRLSQRPTLSLFPLFSIWGSTSTTPFQRILCNSEMGICITTLNHLLVMWDGFESSICCSASRASPISSFEVELHSNPAAIVLQPRILSGA